MIVSKKCVNFPEPGVKFTHKKLGSTWIVIAYYEPAREFFMSKEGSGESMIVTAEGFQSVFREFGKYNEKDLV